MENIPANNSNEILLQEKLKQRDRTIAELKKQLSDSFSEPSSIAGLQVYVIRISNELTVSYLNSAFCTHYKIERERFIGKPFTILNGLLCNELVPYLKRPKEDGEFIEKVTDSSGTVWEVKVTLKKGIQDVVLQDITHGEQMRQFVKRYVSSGYEDYTDKDLETFKYPERRFMSVSFSDLRGFTAMSENMEPEEVRATMNDYLEAVIQAVDDNDATVDKIVGDELMALYGAPKYYKDHAFRAIVTCCEQIANLEEMQESYKRQGKRMPHCGTGINTGDMVIGNMGSSSRQDYTVLGAPVNHAARLCGAALPGQIILTEATLRAVIENLPDAWESVEHTLPGSSTNLEDLGGKTEGVFPLPEHLLGKIISIGPKVKEDLMNTVYRFNYLYSIKVKGVNDPLPVIEVQKEKTILDYTKEILNTDVVTEGNQERIFGKYRLLEKVGSGGMGEVWRARDSFGNIVAIKMLLAGEYATESQVQRFQQEAKVLRSLQHRNICRIHETGEVDNVTYIAMEYIDGVTLAEVLRSGFSQASNITSEFHKQTNINSLITQLEERESDGIEESEEYQKIFEYRVLPLPQIISIIKKICDAVGFAHERGVLHRDLKPANIKIRPDGEPVVMDFGLAKMDQESHTGLTITGQVVGTMEYMSPEQAKSSEELNEQTDVYSLGAILYQMLSGVRHFTPSGNILNDVESLQHLRPKPIRQINRHVDIDLDTVTLKALRVELKDRYRSVILLKDDIEAYEHGAVVSARPVSAAEILWKWVKRHKAVSAVSVVAMFVILMGSVGFVIRLDSEKKEAIAAKVIAEESRKFAELQEASARRNTYAAEMSMLQQNFDRNNIQLTNQLLSRYIPKQGEEDLRGFEWYHLWRKANGYIARVGDSAGLGYESVDLVEGTFTAVALSDKDGTKRIDVWDLKERNLTKSYQISSAEYRGLPRIVVSPKNKYIAAGGSHLTLIKNEKIISPEIHKETVVDVTFSPDEQWMVSASQDGHVCIWDVEREEIVKTLKKHPLGVSRIVFSKDGEYLVTGGGNYASQSQEEMIYVWDTKNWKVVHELGGHSSLITDLIVSDNDDVLLSSSYDRTIHVWSLKTGELLRRVPFENELFSIEWLSPSRIAIANMKGVAIYSYPDFKFVRHLYGPENLTFSLSKSHEEPHFVTSGVDEGLFIWNADMVVNSNASYNESFKSNNASTSLKKFNFSFLRDGSGYVDIDSNQEVRLYNEKGNQPLSLHSSLVNSALMLNLNNTKNGDFLLMRQMDGMAKKFELNNITRNQIALKVQLEDSVLCYDFWSLEGRVIIGSKKEVLLYSVDSGKKLWSYPVEDGVKAVVITEDSSHVICSTGLWTHGNSKLLLLDVETGALVREEKDEQHIRIDQLASSLDSKFVYGGGYGKTVYKWDLDSCSIVKEFRGHTGVVSAICLSPDGKNLASGDTDGDVILWDMTSQQVRMRLAGHIKGVREIRFSKDGRTLSTVDGERTVRKWKGMCGAWIEPELIEEAEKGDYPSMLSLAKIYIENYRYQLNPKYSISQAKSLYSQALKTHPEKIQEDWGEIQKWF